LNRSVIWRRVREAWIATGLTLTAVFVGWSLIALATNRHRPV